MEKDSKKSYYAIIPADVRYDPDLVPNAKLLYGEITALCNEKGYCWAGNNYFAELYGVSKGRVSAWISQLKNKNYIEVKIIYKDGSKEILSRHLYLFSGIGIIKKNKDNSKYYNISKEIYASENTDVSNSPEKKEFVLEKHSLIEKWNNLSGVSKLKYPSEQKENKTYTAALKYIRQLEKGTFLKNKNKYFDPEWLKRNNISPEFLKEIDRPWSEAEIWEILRDFRTLFIEGYTSHLKNKISLKTLLYDDHNNTSFFVQFARTPNKPLKAKRVYQSTDPELTKKFLRLVSLSKVGGDDQEVIKNVNLLIDEAIDVIDNIDGCMGALFSGYVGGKDKQTGKINYRPLLDSFYKYLENKLESGTKIFPGMLKPHVPTWKQFIKWYEEYHDNRFMIYPTSDQIKKIKEREEEERRKQKRAQREKEKRQTLEFAMEEL